MTEQEEKEIEEMINQREIIKTIEELVRIDQWALDAWKMNGNQESPLFLELRRYERAKKVWLEYVGVQVADLDLYF